MSNKLGMLFIITIAVLLLISLVGIIMLAIKLNSNRPYEISLTQSRIPDYDWKIYIDGAVANPGFYPAKADDTITSIIDAAGLNKNANLSNIKIFISSSDKDSSSQKISLNRADTWLLEALPGIGQIKAKAITDYRKQNGPFQRIEDLLKVSGIGRPILEDIKNLITVD